MKQLRPSLPSVQKNISSSLYSPMQKMIDSLLDMVCIVDANGCFTQVSKASKSVLGYTPEEMVGKSFIRMVVEDDREKTLDAMQLLLSGVELNSFENRYYKENGEVVSLSWSVRWDAADALMYCIARDRTEKKISESLHLQYAQKLKRQNKQVADIMERITDGFFAVDDEWRVIYWNKQAEVILGKSREEVLAHNLWDFFPEEKEGIFYQQYQRSVQEQQVVHFEAFLQSMQMWIDVSAYPSENGLSVFFKDNTEQRKVEEELRVLSRVAKQTANSVILTNADEKIVWVNEAFSRMTGYSFTEAIGNVPAVLLQGKETNALVVTYMENQKKKGESFHVELLNYKKNGNIYWSEITCEPIFDENGKVQQFFSIEIDITEKKKLQQQLENEKEEQKRKITAAVIKAQEKERAQVGQELHDNVNQVLTTVKLYTELCLGGIDKSLELMEKSVGLLNASINEIRALSKRLSAPSLGNIPLQESVKELVEAISATGRVTISLTTNIEELDVDTELHLAVYRILQEHLTNVLKHAAATNVEVTLTHGPANLSMVIVDNGKGFSTGDRRKGIGITNMISRADSLSGNLQLISSEGKGCTLLANFPLAS